VTYLQEFLGATQVLRPRHIRYVDQTFHTRSDFQECAIVGNGYDLSFYLGAYFQCRIQGFQSMLCQLLQAKRDTFLLVVEVKYNHIDGLVELKDFPRVLDASP